MTSRIYILLSLFSLHCASGENKNESQKSSSDAIASPNTENTSAAKSENLNKIIGDWILYYIGNDDNGNKQFDEAEKKNAVQHWGRPNDKRKRIWHFNANGTYYSTEQNLKSGTTEGAPAGSTWQLKNESGGEVLYMYGADKNHEPTKGLIMKADGQELQWVHIDDLAPGFIYAFKRS
ncbi:MAG: hypothetical protein ABR503_04585 [Chitinophagaceae bacterium]